MAAGTSMVFAEDVARGTLDNRREGYGRYGAALLHSGAHSMAELAMAVEAAFIIDPGLF